MSDFLPVHFLRPAWLLALPMSVILPLVWRRLRRPTGDWSRVCDPHLLKWLSVGDQARQPSGMGAVMAALALALSAIALAGPSWQRLPDASFAARDARVIALDLSRSMLAQDLKPNRLTRARYRISDVLHETAEGQVGLVAYAGDAFIVSPLTSDTNTIATMLPALRPDIIPVAGSRADRALELAAELLARSGQANGEILLVTDEVEAGDIDVAARLAADDVVISVLAVGTREGAPIPSGSGFVSDSQGNVVITRLDPERMRALADAGKGRLSVLDADATPTLPWKAGEGTEFARRDDGLGERWKDAGPWLALLLLPLVAAGFRRGLLFLLPLALLPWPAQEARAGIWDDLWFRRDQQAQEALANDEPGRAAALARDPLLAGEAWYRSGEYQRAARVWSQLDSADAHYNRGNALAQAGDLEGAISAYDRALEMAPDMEDARYNKALIEQLQEQQQQQQQSEDQSGEGEQQDGDPSQSEQSQEGEESQQQEGEQGEERESQDSQGEDGQQSQEQMAQAWTEEDEQAMEQWLRRIPDDPGGLLRRKFRNEHQRRGGAKDERQPW